MFRPNPGVVASVVLINLLLSLVANPAFAHGGSYRGPRGNPGGDPSPGPLGGPGATPGGAGPGGGTTPGRGGGGGTGYERWENWWGFNQDPYLQLKSHLLARSLNTENQDYSLGKADERNEKTTINFRNELLEEKIVPALTEALRDSFFDVRAAAVIGLGKVGRPSDLPLLMRSLSDENKRVRESTALALGILGNEESILILTEILNNTATARRVLGRSEILTRTRAFAAVGLGLSGVRNPHRSDEIVSILTKTLRVDESQEDVAVCSALALGVMKNERALPSLIQTFRDGSRSDILHAHVVVALGKIGNPAALPLVHEAFRSKSHHVVRSGIIALGLLAHSADSYSVKLLENWLQKGPESLGKGWALVSLGKIGGPQARKTLLHVLATDQKWRKTYAALGLAQIALKNEGVSDAARVHRVFQDLKGDSAPAAFSIALGLMKYKPAAADLAALARDKGDPDMRGYSAIALGLMGAHEHSHVIRELLTERREPIVQRFAATALGLLGDPTAVPLLLDLLRNAKTEYAMSSAANALGQIGDDRAVDPLIRILRDRAGTPDLARANATTALGVVGDRNLLPPFHGFATDVNYVAQVDALNELLTIR